MSFTDRIVIVTGAGGAVGTQVTRRWLEEGATVVGAGSSERSLSALGDHERFAPFVADLTTEAGAKSMVDFAQSRFGPPDTLIHTVGGFTMGPTVGEEAPAQWDQMMALNATSAFHCYRAMIPVLRERKGGWIVGIGSRAASEPAGQLAAYAASKAALVALTRSLAAEFRNEDIHVNVILPSTIDTKANRGAMGDKNAGKWVSLDDIAEATIFLCSDASRSIHGATLEIYGKA